MSGSEIWLQFKTFMLAVPPWLSALPTWLTTVLVLAIGILIGRAIKARSVKLQEQQAARDTLRLALDVMKLDPALQQAPGLGQAVLAQLKAQKHLKISSELEQLLMGARTDATVAAVAAETAPAKPAAPTEAKVEKAAAPPEPKTKPADTTPPPKVEPKAAEPEPKADAMKSAAKPEGETKTDKPGRRSSVFDMVDDSKTDKTDAAAKADQDKKESAADKKKGAADKKESTRDKPGRLRDALLQTKE
ncbi:MAG: hypothetical protein ACR2PO_01900 [Methyloligellaceae bacterium]